MLQLSLIRWIHNQPWPSSTGGPSQCYEPDSLCHSDNQSLLSSLQHRVAAHERVCQDSRSCQEGGGRKKYTVRGRIPNTQALLLQSQTGQLLLFLKGECRPHIVTMHRL